MGIITVEKISPIKIFFGALLVVLGAILFLTIVGILPGITIAFAGMALLSKRVECFECRENMLVFPGAKNAKCRKCKTIFLIEWK